MTEAETIANRIEQAISGTAFTAFDFSDISSARNAGNVLGRMYSKGQLAKAIRGVYYVSRVNANSKSRHVSHKKPAELLSRHREIESTIRSLLAMQ